MKCSKISIYNIDKIWEGRTKLDSSRNQNFLFQFKLKFTNSLGLFSDLYLTFSLFIRSHISHYKPNEKITLIIFLT